MMDRRTFIAAAPASVATMAQADQQDTEILRLFREHQAIQSAASNHVCTETGKNEDAELDRLFYDKAHLIANKMLALPSTCAADFAAKTVVETCCGGLLPDWETSPLWIEARALTGGVL